MKERDFPNSLTHIVSGILELLMLGSRRDCTHTQTETCHCHQGSATAPARCVGKLTSQVVIRCKYEATTSVVRGIVWPAALWLPGDDARRPPCGTFHRWLIALVR